MKNFTLVISILLLVSCSDTELDLDLDVVRDINDLRPLPTRQFEEDPKYILGKALFFDPVLSGNRDVACSTCHLWSKGSGDGIPFSIGVNGKGLGEGRYLPDGQEIEHPRHSMDLWNRDNNTVRTLFWDGRVEALGAGRFRTPMGEHLPSGLENTLAVQAIFPLVRADEMLGLYGTQSSKDLPYPHANQPNELVQKKEFENDIERIFSAQRMIVKRLIGEDNPEEWQQKYRSLILSAYPNEELNEITIVHIANALSHYEELAFATRSSKWDEYLKGNRKALTADEKKGALLFYGKGKCSACHSGPLMSDFEFHSIGVPQSGPGIENGKDYGRYHVTGDPKDKYKFRTAPLRNVSLSSPYFHTGFIDNLEDAVKHHLDPLYYADKYKSDGGFVMTVEQIESISPILTSGIRLDANEVAQIVKFLETLESKADKEMLRKIIPRSVPSGLEVPVLLEDY